jgi:hypothetical protein
MSTLFDNNLRMKGGIKVLWVARRKKKCGGEWRKTEFDLIALKKEMS